MRASSWFSAVAVGIAVGIAVGLVCTSDVFAETGEKKQCGGRDDDDKVTTNAQCPNCVGTCKLNLAGRAQKYTKCEGEGEGCEDNVSAFCTGRLYDGTGTGGGCTGDDVGTCQYDIMKCNQPASE